MIKEIDASTDKQDSPDKHGRKMILAGTLRSLIVPIVLFGAAGTISWTAGWVFVITSIAFSAVSAIVLAKLNPEILNVRGQKAKDAAWHDKVIIKGLPVLHLLVIIIAGLDFGRYHWSAMPSILAAAGWFLIVAGGAFLTWSMVVNRHFEMTVRIQTDRDHRVCMDGPYRIVRHPGYSGLILTVVGCPLLLGSWPAFIPVLITIVMFVARTRMEDRKLISELPGYREFTGNTRYRLVPGLW